MPVANSRPTMLSTTSSSGSVKPALWRLAADIGGLVEGEADGGFFSSAVEAQGAAELILIAGVDQCAAGAGGDDDALFQALSAAGGGADLVGAGGGIVGGEPDEGVVIDSPGGAGSLIGDVAVVLGIIAFLLLYGA